MTSHLPENQRLRKNATCKRVIVYAGQYLMFFGLSKIVSAKCSPSGLIITKITLFLMDCKAMRGFIKKAYKQEFLSQKSSELNQTSDSYRLPEYQFKYIIKKLLLSLPDMAQHHNGAIRNDPMVPSVLCTLGII